MDPWHPLDQSGGRVAPALGWMGSMVAPAKEALGTPEDLWGHGMCFHAEEQTPKEPSEGLGLGLPAGAGFWR